MRKTKKYLIGICIAVAVIVVAAVAMHIYNIYNLRGLTVLDNPIFSIDPEEISCIKVSYSAEYIAFTDPAEIQELTEMFNTFEWKTVRAEPDTDGCGVGVDFYRAGEEEPFVSCSVSGQQVRMDGIWYYGPQNYFDPLQEMFGKNSPERQSGIILLR